MQRPIEQSGSTATWVRQLPHSKEVLTFRRCLFQVIGGPKTGLTLQSTTPTVLIGRGDADLVLADRHVSLLHAEVRLEARGYRIRDLGSTNGTYVNGVRVVDALLSPQDVLTVGESRVRFAPLSETLDLPLSQDHEFCGMYGQSPPMRQLFEQIDCVAATDSVVLISGETGTGKELVAEALHERSSRASRPFVVVDCGAIPRGLFESTLFGHVAGAFTGANKDHQGLFATAEGGTLFLDEVGELPLSVQVKLLRTLSTHQMTPVGGQQRPINVRLISATNRDLATLTNQGTFRADLYYRLAVVRLHVPALRDRREDIEPLCRHFLGVPNVDPAKLLPEGFLDWAQIHDFPGNVRELRNAVERALTIRDFGTEDALCPSSRVIDLKVPFKEAKRRILEDFERRYATALAAAHQGNISAAARAAGLDRMSIYKLFARLNLAR